MKRDNELVEKVEAIISDTTISEENRTCLGMLLNKYKSATYKEWDDRHEWNAGLLSDMVNDYGFKDEMIAEKMATDHPTLQQTFMRFVLKFIRKMAAKPYFDDRNKASVAIAREIVKTLDEKGEYLPFI